jgi:hypothetical protein
VVVDNEEQEKQEAAEEAQIQEFRFNFLKLVESLGWAALLKAAETQIKVRERSILNQRVKSVDEALEQECLKGEILGMRALIALPQTFIEAHTPQEGDES